MNPDYERAIFSKYFLFGVIAFVLVAAFAAVEPVVPMLKGSAELEIGFGFHNELMITVLDSKAMLLFMPIICAIPYTTSFLDDCKDRYINIYLHRVTYKKYILNKLFSTALSGGLVLLLGGLVCWFSFYLVFTPMEVKNPIESSFDNEINIENILEMEESENKSAEDINKMMIIGKLCIYSCYGAVLSVVGALLAAVTKSKYAAYASPFVFHYILVIMSERYFKGFYVFNPQEWLNPQEYWVYGRWGIFLLIAEIFVILGIIYYFVILRSLKDE